MLRSSLRFPFWAPVISSVFIRGNVTAEDVPLAYLHLVVAWQWHDSTSVHDAKCLEPHRADRTVMEQNVSFSLFSPKDRLKLKPLYWLQFSSICRNTLERERGWQLTSGFSPSVTYLTLTRCYACLSPPRSVGKRQKKYKECL